MKRELFKQITAQVEDEPIYDMTLGYYLLTDVAEEDAHDFFVYGVEVVKEASDIEAFCGKERKIIKGLFFKKDEAESFLDLISRNQVTPIGLKCVVKDYFCDKIGELTV